MAAVDEFPTLSWHSQRREEGSVMQEGDDLNDFTIVARFKSLPDKAQYNVFDVCSIPIVSWSIQSLPNSFIPACMSDTG